MRVIPGNRLGFTLVAISSVAVLAALLAGGCGSNQPVVNKMDHVTIATSDAANLFAFFTEGLGLPSAWPYTQYPGFSSGGVQAGNVNLETLGMVQQSSTGKPAEADIYGTVFEPAGDLAKITPELEARGAEPGKPKEQTMTVNGQNVLLYTTMTLDALTTKAYIVYLCQYSADYKAKLDAHKATPPLGGIGLMSTAEIDIIAKDVSKARDQWSKIFAPAKMNKDGLMPIGSGPAVRITAGPTDVITTIVFNVQDLQKAVTFLQGKNMLKSSTSSVAVLDPTKSQGVQIKLVQGK
jgi:hypothetical protein